MTSELIQPPILKAGDTVAIVAPSGILNNRNKEINQAVTLLKSWGLNTKIGEHVFDKSGHFAGTDEDRISDLQQAIDDNNVKAIWMARGGYGMVRVIDEIDYSSLKSNPKWIIGYSDITALHNNLHNIGMESIHAMMCTSMTDDPEEIKTSINSLKDVLFGNSMSYETEGSSYNKVGEASGQLVGGNLTLLHTMLGSKSSINPNGKILFIEEIGEYAYHIDRMLMSLKRAGYFKGCEGLIVGHISNVRVNTTPWGKPMEQLILDAFKDYDFPILFDFPAGHEDDNRALILGRSIELKVEKDKGSVIFSD
ncbi:MAG: LD-carboxypeptidase [Flavobacteriaceae bacterium]|nr:LD-carboxypeptidase [Flavobacteriaceae bacterium]